MSGVRRVPVRVPGMRVYLRPEVDTGLIEITTLKMHTVYGGLNLMCPAPEYAGSVEKLPDGTWRAWIDDKEVRHESLEEAAIRLAKLDGWVLNGERRPDQEGA
jgi:hypothetical protein